MDNVSISNDTTVLVSVGTLITVFGALIKMVYNYARLELKQDYMQKDLNGAHTKIRELEKKP